MSSKNFKIVLIVSSILILFTLLGGSWETSSAQGTIPEAPPPAPIVPLIPVTGNCAGPHLQDVGGVCVNTASVEKGLTIQVKTAKDEDVPELKDLSAKSAVMRVYVSNGKKEILDYGFITKSTLYFELSPDALKAFKRDASIHILWYNPVKQEWEEVETTLESGTNRLTAQITKCGIYIVGSLPKP